MNLVERRGRKASAIVVEALGTRYVHRIQSVGKGLTGRAGGICANPHGNQLNLAIDARAHKRAFYLVAANNFFNKAVGIFLAIDICLRQVLERCRRIGART